MTKQSINIGDNEVLDAALESVAAEAHSKPKKDAPSENKGADKKVADLEQQVREANDRALRSHAELENFRKRSQRELADERKYAIVPFAKDLLSVVDNLERAIEAANKQIDRLSEGAPSAPLPLGEGGRRPGEGGPASSGGHDITHLLDGVQMVATQLESILKQHGAVRIETVGTPFDPNFHQAISQEPSDEYPAGTITRAFQSGYTLHDRVIRPAQVFVSTGPAAK